MDQYRDTVSGIDKRPYPATEFTATSSGQAAVENRKASQLVGSGSLVGPRLSESAKCSICKGRGKLSRRCKYTPGRYRTRRCPICVGTGRDQITTARPNDKISNAGTNT